VLDVNSNATGLVPADWQDGGEYENVSTIIKLPFPWITIVSFLLVTVFIVLAMCFYYLLQKIKWYKVVESENKI
jgi:hypothetical protein